MQTPALTRIAAIVIGIALAAPFLPAQLTRGGTPSGATGSASTGGFPSSPGSVGSNPSTIGNNPSNPGGFPGDQQGPIFLSGKVMLNDGTVPSEPVLIERVCNGTPRPQGYTDSKGRFSFQLGTDPGAIDDASYDISGRGLARANSSTGGLRENALWSCDLRAALPGFRSDVVSLASRRSLDNPDVGTIVLHRNANVEGLTTSVTSLQAPKDARKSYEKALEAVKKNKAEDARKELEKAVGIYPKYASAWFELGKLDEQSNQVEEARKDYAQALAADSKYVNPYERLYLLAVKETKWQEAADTTDKVLHLNPYDFPNAYYFNAFANLQLGHLDVAEKSARQAIELDTGHQNPRAGYVLGIVLAQKQDFAGSAKYLREYLKAVPETDKDAEVVRKQLADVEKFAQEKAEVKP